MLTPKRLNSKSKERTHEAAEKAWTDFDKRFDDFGKLVETLEKTAAPPLGGLGELVESIRISAPACAEFSSALVDGHPLVLPQQECAKILSPLFDALQPETDVLILPLTVGRDSIGMVVLDNKFTQRSMGELEIEIAMNFVTAAGSSLQNTLLFNATSQVARWAEKTEKAGSHLNQADTPEDAAERLLQSVAAQGVGVMLCNAAGEVRERYVAGNAKPFTKLRPDGISVEVMLTGTPWWTPDAQYEPRINRQSLLPADRAMVCVPMKEHEQIVGVTWISYSQPREFEPEEIVHFEHCVERITTVCSGASNRKAAHELVAAVQKAAGRADLRDVTAALVRYARVSFGACSATFWPWDAESNRFLPQLLASDGLPEDDLEFFRSHEPRPGFLTHQTLEKGYYPVPDVGKEPLVADTYERLISSGIRSFHAALLAISGDKFGVLYVSYPYARSFGRDDRSSLISFAAYAAWLIATTRQSRRTMTAQSLAQKTARQFALGGSNDVILRDICEHAVSMFECTNAILFQYDQSSNSMLNPPTSAGTLKNSKYLQRCKAEIPDPWLEALLESEGPVIEEHVSEKYADKRFARDEGIKTFVAIPLRALSRTVGLLFINFQNKHRVTDQEKHDCQLLADFAATALHSAQHYAHLVGFSTALLRCSTVREVLQVAVRETARLMGTPLCDIVLRRQDGRLGVSEAYGWQNDLDGFALDDGLLSQSGYTLDQGKPVWVDDYESEARFRVPSIITDSAIKSGLSAILCRGKDAAGVLLVHSVKRRSFRELDIHLLESLANQISQALERAQHFEESEAKRSNISALNESSRAIIRSIKDLEVEKVYSAILEQAVRGVNGKANLATLLLFDPESGMLSPAAVYPSTRNDELRERIGSRWSVHTGHDGSGRIGVVGMAVVHHESQLVNDVLAEQAQNYYVELSATTRSNLAIPLLDETDSTVGVLNVESDRAGAFDQRDIEVLQGLALVMVIVLQVGIKHADVLKARGEARARLILAWLGFAANHGWHTNRAHLATVSGAAVNIRDELNKRLGTSVPRQVIDNLQVIERVCQEMLVLDLAPPLDSHDARAPAYVNEFLSEFCDEIDSKFGSEFSTRRSLTTTNGTSINVNVSWLRCALRILVDNAVRELRKVPKHRRALILASRLHKSEVELIVEDHGRGIPTEIQQYLGKGVVPGALGVGVGYLIAQAVAETYGGSLTFQTGGNGTQMILRLPGVRS